MFFALLRFELARHLRRPATLVFALVFFALAFLLMNVAGGAFPGAAVSFGGDRVFADAPSPLAGMTALLVFLGTLVTAAVVGGAATRDFAAGMHPLVFTTPVPKGTLLAARFAAACVVMTLVFLAIPLGFGLGRLMPYLEPGKIGGSPIGAYLAPMGLFVLPDLLLTAALFFAVGLWARRMLPVYLSGVGLLLGYLAAGSVGSEIERRTLAALLDPFGLRALSVLTEYWSVAEQNARLVPLSGVLLQNRLLWLAVGAAVLGLAVWRFRFGEVSGRSRKGKEEAPAEAPSAAIAVPNPVLDFGALTGWRAFLSIARREFFSVVRSGGFLLLVLGGLGFLAVNATQLGSLYGTDTYPVTYQVLEVFGGLFGLFILIIVAFYAGEAVWRERDVRIDGVVDALPVPTVVPLLAKLAGLIGVVAVLLGVLMLGGMATQLALGYTHFEVGQYVQELFGFQLLSWALIVVLAVAVHVVVDRKATGHLVLVAYTVAVMFFPQLGLEHNLWAYGSDPGRTYSDMNGYGAFVLPFVAFNAYWAAWALLLAVGSALLWRRGAEGTRKTRLALLRQRLGRPARIALGLGAVGVLVLGGFVLYNTNVRNTYVSSQEVEERQAEYERRYRRYEGAAQPRITDVRLAVDLYPDEGRARIAGTYRMVNRTRVPIDSLHVILQDDVDVDTLSFGRPATQVIDDPDHLYHVYRLATPLAPGDSLTVRFRLRAGDVGFTNDGEAPTVAANGAFLNTGLLPSFGYDRNYELTTPRVRRRHDLPERPAMRDPADPVGRSRTYVTGDADWITFEATVSTSADQTALAPGTLVRTWTEDGRRFFHYRAPAPMLWFASFLSGRYQVYESDWRAPDGRTIPIQVFHHPAHDYNLARMTESARASLDYYTRWFGPYQATEVRIVEFPRYADFAQAFLGTIPYSESIGFIARVRDTTEVDFPYFVTAHEVAHQWWAHQLIGADVRGATLLSETLAEYSALMVMRERYGDAQIRRFTTYDRDRYLSARGIETDREQPLLDVENQGYIHYNKGGIAMYALQAYVGEAAVNGALRRVLEAHRFQGPPYPVARDLYRELQRATPDSLRYLLSDLFERITFYDLRTTGVEAVALPDGRTRITLTIEAAKTYADGEGRETDAPMNDLVQIGVLDDDGSPLYARMHRLRTGTNRITVVVRGTPAEAGADVFGLLIDRNSRDNLRDVEAGGATD